MSQQHPSSFPPHLPRGPVAASQLAKNQATAVLRAGPSPAIQIPAAPSVSSVSVSIPGLPTAIARTPVISAIRPTTPPTTRPPSPNVSATDHSRSSLIVHGAGGQGAGTGPLPGQPLQITLTQRLTSSGQPVEGLKAGALTTIGAKTVHVPSPVQPHQIVQHQKVAPAVPQSAGTIGIAPQQIQQQAVLAASKPGGLTVSAAVPAISISSLPATPLPTGAVMAPTSAPASTSIPIAKVTPQRQHTPLVAGIPAPIAVQAATSGSEFVTVPDLGAMTTQAGSGHLLLSQTHRSQAGAVGVSSAVPTLATSVPTVATSLTPQHGDRALPQNLFNLAAATPAQAQDPMWHFLYQQAQLVSTTQNPTGTPLVRPASTFFVPRPSSDQSKLTSQSPNLAASLSHPLPPGQPAVLFNTRAMMVDSLRQPLPLSTPASFSSTTPSTTSTITITAATNDARPVISLSASSSAVSGIGSTVLSSAPSSESAFPPASSSSSLHLTGGMSVSAGLLGMGSVGLTPRPTVASSIIAAASAHQAQSAGGPQQAPGTPGGSGSNPGSSPRPSILRKRTLDSTMVVPKRPNFNLQPESHSPRPDTTSLSNISSPRTPATENSQSSTDTALSSNDATTPTHNSHSEVRVKCEPLDSVENGPSAASPAVSLSGSTADASPRKRARKQLLNASEELKDNTSTDEDMESETVIKEESPDRPPVKRDEYIDEEGVRWTTERTKPTMSIMGDYTTSWKPRCNHFLRYSDVKPKDDRRPTVNELANQRGILQKSSGWKLFHVAAQLEDLMENEGLMQERMAKLKEMLAARVASRPHPDHDLAMLQELTQANLQRCQLVSDQLQEAKNNMLAILNHRPKIQEIIHKNLSKRPIKKKERT